MVFETGNKFAVLGFGTRGATLESSVSAQWYQNPTNSIVNNTFASPMGGSIYYQASQPSTTLTRSCLSGLCNQTATSALTYTSATHTVYLGTTQVNSAHVNGVISQVVIDPSPSRCPENYPSQNLSIAWLGDSIIAGTGSTPSTPVQQLKAVTDPGSVFNLATGGYTTAQCATRWTSAAVTGAGHRTLIWSCGVNDMATGVSGATAWANTQAVVAAARAAGMKVIITSIAPWKNSSGWTAGKQTETAAYNAAASAWAGANGALYVDLFTPMGGGGDPDVLAVAYDSGDLIHPNATGAGIIASLVGAQNP
jgi:lysophospholipase L1-like esterase